MFGIETLKEKINLLTTENKTLREKISQYVTSTKELKETISVKEAKIAELENKINEMEKSIRELIEETSSDSEESEEDHSKTIEESEEEILQTIEITPINDVTEEENKEEVEEEDEISDLKTSEGYYLYKEQADCYNAMENSKDNIFITGKAGTGKSTILKYFRDNTKKKVVVVAPTGIAAINVQGQTIHSLFKLHTGIQDISNYSLIAMNSTTKKTLEAINTIIIDEISMVRSDVMDMIDAKLKAAHKNRKPFGGCQIIAFGDLYQLPPILENDEAIIRWFNDHYKSEYFFSSKAVNSANFKIIELEKVHRQNDKTFIDILNSIRLGSNSDNILKTINERVTDYPKDIPIVTITPTRDSAEKINKERLDAIDNPEYIYEAELNGKFRPEDTIADMELHLKIGAQIMMIKNDANKRWVNGTVGIISDLNNYFIEVKIGKYKYVVSKETWEKTEYVYNEEEKTLEQKKVGSCTQYPIKLAYAITIHKSQGKTLENVIIDYTNGGAFANGQTYVALSRAKSLDGLYLTSPISAADIKIDNRVNEYMKTAKRFYEAKDNKEDKIINTKQVPNSFSLDTITNNFNVAPIENPKKITGTRLGSILNKNKYETPLAAWAAMMRIYEPEFDESNPYLTAGRFVEPKQINYVKNNISKNIKNPDEYYNGNARRITGYDFFKNNEIFGGMWDAVEVKDDKIIRVYEMKTTSMRHKSDWDNDIPENYKLQGCLYAYLLGVDDVTFVVTFLENNQYQNPVNSVTCDSNNTKVINCKVSKLYPEFDIIIGKAKEWWRNHILTGKAPKVMQESDIDLLTRITE